MIDKCLRILGCVAVVAMFGIASLAHADTDESDKHESKGYRFDAKKLLIEAYAKRRVAGASPLSSRWLIYVFTFVSTKRLSRRSSDSFNVDFFMSINLFGEILVHSTNLLRCPA